MLPKKTILVIEDDISFLKFLEVILNKFGYNILSKNNVEDALQYLKNEKFDLVIVDIKLQGAMNGIEFIKHLRVNLSKTLPVIILTGNISLEEYCQAMDLNVDKFLYKPIKSKELITLINEILKNDSEITKKLDNDINFILSQID